MADINEIIGQISDAGGLARPTLFKVNIASPKVFSTLNQRKRNFQDRENLQKLFAERQGEPIQNLGLRKDYFDELTVDPQYMEQRLNFMCQRTELPSATFSTSDARTYGSYFKIPYVDTYADLNMEFIVGRDMLERYFFDAWRYTIQDPETADFNYVDEYATVIDVIQLDEYDNATYGVRFFQAWPLSVGSMHLAYDGRNEYHVLPVTFTYRKWINIVLETSTPVEIKAAGGQPQPFKNTIKKPVKMNKGGCEL